MARGTDHFGTDDRPAALLRLATAGSVAVGDKVLVLPGGLRTTVEGVDTADGPLAAATAGRSLTLLLSDAIDVSRGDMIVAADEPPVLTDELDAALCWLAETPLRPGMRVLVKHGTRTVNGQVTEVTSRFSEQTLTTTVAPGELRLNEIGQVLLRVAQPLPVDAYRANRRTGSFLVIDPADGTTLAAGLVGAPLFAAVPPVISAR